MFFIPLKKAAEEVIELKKKSRECTGKSCQCNLLPAAVHKLSKEASPEVILMLLDMINRTQSALLNIVTENKKDEQQYGTVDAKKG